MRTPDFWQALLSLDLQPAKARELLERIGASCNTAEELAGSPGLTSEERKKLSSFRPCAANADVIGWDSDGYPANLRTTSNPPPALFVRGQLFPQDTVAVAIVGTRKPSVYGRAVAKKLAMELASGGVTVVSGAAHGIDAEAHRGALSVGGRTIAVLGSGVDKPYPAAHRGLLDEIAKQGAVVSQFALGTQPDYWRFPMRNFVIAGLSKAVIIVEAPEASGALVTASSAGEEGRHVFATPAQIDSLSHRGNFRLINDGATLLYTPDQVFEALGIERRVGKREKPKLTAQQEKILSALTKTPELADNLSAQLGESAGVVLAELTRLELEGLVQKSSGGYIKL
jgi:DNA processing protein